MSLKLLEKYLSFYNQLAPGGNLSLQDDGDIFIRKFFDGKSGLITIHYFERPFSELGIHLEDRFFIKDDQVTKVESDIFDKSNDIHDWTEITTEVPYLNGLRHGLERRKIKFFSIDIDGEDTRIDNTLTDEYYTWDRGNLTGPYYIAEVDNLSSGYYFYGQREGILLTVDRYGKTIKEQYFINDNEVTKEEYFQLIAETSKALLESLPPEVVNIVSEY